MSLPGASSRSHGGSREAVTKTGVGRTPVARVAFPHAKLEIVDDLNEPWTGVQQVGR